MSDRDSNLVEVEENLKDITECSICTETFKEPKVLSCIHTFCMNCLQQFGASLEKNPGDQMSCPICRKEFRIPDEGFTGLQRNFFMERLIEMKNNLKPYPARVLCEICLEDRDSDNETDIPPAEMYCLDCGQSLCADCNKRHAKRKLTKTHRTIGLDCQQQAFMFSPESRMREFCGKHKKKLLDIYCSDCKNVVCTNCFLESHKYHEGVPIDSALEAFKNQISENVDILSAFASDLGDAKRKQLLDKTEFLKQVSDMETEIIKAREELIKMIHRHWESILSEIKTQKDEIMKESEIAIDDIETLLSCLNSFKIYYTEVMTIGSASNICETAESLNNRADELKQLFSSRQRRSFEFPYISLKTPNLVLHFKSEGGLIVVKVKVETARSETERGFNDYCRDCVPETQSDQRVSKPVNNYLYE